MVYTYLEPVFKVLILILMKILQTEAKKHKDWYCTQGRIQDFFLGGGALVSCATSTPINHIVFHFLQNTSCIRKPQVISRGGGAHPLHPPPRSAPGTD